MMDLNITNEELNALKLYIEERYKAINQMLVSDAESDIALLSNEVENSVEPISYSREFIIENLRYMKLIYKLILKHCYKVPRKISKIYRGTNIAEIERTKNELFIDKPLIATTDREVAENRCAANWNRPASMNISLEKNVPFIVVGELLSDTKKSDTIVIAPFTRVKEITESLERKLDDTSKYLKTYDVKLEKQELEELTDRERNGLYNYIVENAYCINKKLEDCIELEKENAVNFENIRKLEQLLAKYENTIEEKETGEEEYTEIERENDFESVARVTRELDELKETSTNLFEVRKENINFINLWKRNIAVYMIAECKEIEKLFRDLEYPEPIIEEVPEEDEKMEETQSKEEILEAMNEEENKLELNKIDTELEAGALGKKLIENRMKIVNGNIENKLEDEIVENKNIEEDDNLKNNVVNLEDKFDKNNDKIIELKNYSNLKKSEEERIEKTEEETNENKLVDTNDNTESDDDTKIFSLVQEVEVEQDPLYTRVKDEAKENIEASEKLLEDINNLITKQQNHAKIAGSMGTSYSALNNAFEMRKVSETLLELLQNINLKVKTICEQEKTEEIEEKLEKISKSNIEISTLINYLNNPKIAARNSKATRFDEMAIIEENELKRGIAEKIREIRGEAELKKLKDDLEIIEDKGTFIRFLGIITGKNKLDNIMIEQIEVRSQAIRRTLSKKLSLAHNYSIHELMADIVMFVDENEDDELIENDVNELKALAEELRRNYIILESKVQSIIEEKEGIKLPIDDRKLSKQEILEMETHRFLKKYGYDMLYNDREEPKYQDTMANEIARIVEYINSAKIL